MTIFDTLRYPISELPTKEELAALPVELFSQWVWQSHWSDEPHRPREIVRISDYYHSHSIDESRPINYKSEDDKDIALLRKLIREYDEPI
jgi:hypothetical protein